MNKLSKNNSITSSFLRNKKIKVRKNIDTIIIDDNCHFYYNNIKNIIFDWTKIKGDFYVNSNLKYIVKNISFINYPMLEGITIPFEVIKIDKNKKFNFEGAPSTLNIKKINVLYDDYVEVIPIDENINYFKVDTFIEKEEPKIKIELLENYTDIEKKNIRNIIFDSNGKLEYYGKYYLNIKNNEDLDIRQCFNKKSLYLNDEVVNLNKLSLSINTLRNIKLYNFDEIKVKKLEIIDDNEMKLIPNNISLDNVYVTIKNINNSFALLTENIETKEIKYIYLGDCNKLNIIDDKEIKRIKWTYISDTIGLIIQYKNNLKLDLILNNKIYKIDRIFINWIMGNFYAKELKEKLLPEEYIKIKNILELDKVSLNDIKEIIYDKLLECVFYRITIRKFKEIYEIYEKYLKHLEYLKEKGLTNKALYYLHKYNYDNITGVNDCFNNEMLENELVIDSFNNLGKMLVKRKG